MVSLLFVFPAACSGESEGQPCDPAAGGTPTLGSADCASGLICTPHPNSSTDGSRCCPPNLANATTPECMIIQGAGFDASPAPPDSPYDTGTPDAPAESAADTGAPGDAAGDASGIPDATDANSPADAADAAPGTDGSGE